MKSDFNQLGDIPYPALTKQKQKVRSRPASSNTKKYSKGAMRSTQKSGWGNSSKYLSKNLRHNKNNLYDEALVLKRAVNTLKAENIQLKNRVLKGERELNEKNREVKGLLNKLNGHSKKGKTKKADPVINLKRQVFDLQNENKAIREGLESLKQSLKVTTREELSIEIQAYSQECAKLRNALEEIVNDKPYAASSDAPEEIRKQDNMIEKLKVENKNLAEQLKTVKSELDKLKSKDTKFTSSNDPTAKEQEKEIQILRGHLEDLKKSSGVKGKVEELQKEKIELAKKGAEYEEMIRDLSMQIIQEKRAKKNELREESPEEEKKEVLKLVDKDVAHEITTALRLNMILSNIEFKSLKKVLFKNCEEDDKVSIYELEKIFKRNPCSLKADLAVKLARYLIEPKKKKEIEYDPLLEEKVSTIFGNLALIMGTYTLKHNSKPEVIQESLLGKLNEKVEDFAEILQNSADSKGYILLGELEKVCKEMGLGLSNDELDYLLLTMYKKSKSIDKLQCENLLKHLEDLINNLVEKQEGLELEDHIDKSKEKSAREESIKEKEQQVDEAEGMSEEELLPVIQKCFAELSKAMKAKGLSIASLFKEEIYTRKIKGEEIELVSFDNFIKAPKKLGIPTFTPIERSSMEKVLSLVGPEKGLQVSDLVQILEGSESMEREMGIEDLDKVSMVLLLALSDYITDGKTSIDQVFEHVIYKQPVEIDNEELEIEIMDSSKFFDVINKIGIETEESQHDNLKAFLCIDPEHIDKLSLEKLRSVVNEFKENKDLRSVVKEYYKQLIEDSQLQEGGDNDM